MSSTPRNDHVEYLLQLATTEQGRDYKRRLLAELELRPGLTICDVGCGPGADLAMMAERVGAEGRVIGVDHDPEMVAVARAETDDPRIEVRLGSAEALPLDDGSVDRARIDRVLMHVDDPGAVLAEARRVLRPGGVIGLAEPDWDTLAFDAEDLETTRAYTRYVARRVIRNGTIGRRLPRLAMAAGFSIRSVIPSVTLFRDYASGERILGMDRVAARGVQAGELDADATRRWLADLTEGPFLAACTFYTVVAQR